VTKKAIERYQQFAFVIKKLRKNEMSASGEWMPEE